MTPRTDPPLSDLVAHALAVLDEAIAEHKPSHVFALLSGGHDSLAAAAVAAKHPAITGICLVNTGIGIEETRQFVRDRATGFGLPLLEYHPPESYRDIVLAEGFPGPGSHPIIYVRLKERCFDALVRDHKTHHGDRVMLVSGIRAEESVDRRAAVPVARDGAAVWVNPILPWSKVDCGRLIAAEGLPRNRVVDLLHFSGECLCGSKAKRGDRTEIRRWFPDVAAEITALEAEVEAAGLTHACRWGQRPTIRGQLRLGTDRPMRGCQSCEARAA